MYHYWPSQQMQLGFLHENLSSSDSGRKPSALHLSLSASFRFHNKLEDFNSDSYIKGPGCVFRCDSKACKWAHTNNSSGSQFTPAWKCWRWHRKITPKPGWCILWSILEQVFTRAPWKQLAGVVFFPTRSQRWSKLTARAICLAGESAEIFRNPTCARWSLGKGPWIRASNKTLGCVDISRQLAILCKSPQWLLSHPCLPPPPKAC